MNILIDNIGKIVTHEQIYKTLYNDNFDEFGKGIVTHKIFLLRKKTKGIFVIINRPKIGFCLKKIINNEDLDENESYKII